MNLLLQWTQQLAERVAQAIKESGHFARYNASAVGLLGVIGFPLYYYIWAYLFPQPYESLCLRLTGAAVCLPLLFHKRWPARWQGYFPVYLAASLTYSLPFLFTYMLLRNQMSLVWSLSTMAAFFLLVLAIYDWLLIILMAVTGVALAWALYLMGGHLTVPLNAYLEQIPIYAFLVIGGGVFNYSARLVKEEKLKAYATMGRNIAHELRTPLLGIRSAMSAVSHYLPTLIDAHEQATSAGLPVTRIRTSRFEKLRESATRIEDEITYSNTIIDMLLLSAGQASLRTHEFSIHSCNKTLSQALERYPFTSDRERNLIDWTAGPDFQFYGSDLLVNHILFNLIKNALHSVLSARRGRIEIATRTTSDHNLVTVTDTGTGISARELPRIFEHFYTSKGAGQGTGIGLYFCKLAMESFDGEIRCDSRAGDYTRFTLVFPKVAN